jgi:hypothetical protein
MGLPGFGGVTYITTRELRESLSAAIERVMVDGEHIVLRENDQDVMALVSVADLGLLRESEDRLDLEEMRGPKEEPGPKIPWEQVCRDWTTKWPTLQ